MPQRLKSLFLILLLFTLTFQSDAEARRGRNRRVRTARIHYTPVPSNVDNSVTAAEEASGIIYKHNPYLPDGVPQCPVTPEAMAAKLKPADIKIFGVIPINETLESTTPIKIQACVIANNDRDAARYCSGAGKFSQKLYSILNPGNKQYSSSGKGEYNTNPDNYYYCIANSLNMIEIKSRVCTSIRDYFDDLSCSVPDQNTSVSGDSSLAEDDSSVDDFGFSSNWVEQLPPMVRWNALHRNGDGTCECNGELDCPRLAQDVRDLRCAFSQEGCGSVATTATTRRDNHEEFHGVSNSSSDGTNSAPSAETLVQRCIATEQQKADSCKTSVSELERICAQTDSTNRNINTASQAITGLGGAATSNMASSGQGTYGTCVQAGAMALGASAALQTTQQQCAGRVATCDACRSNQIGNFLDGCSRAAHFSNFEALRAAKPELAQQLTAAHDSLTEIYDRTTTACNQGLPQQQDQLSQLMGSLGNTARASTSCACKTSSSGGSNCDTIPTLEACAANPAATGCQAYLAPSLCATGSTTYDAKACGCIQNPTAAGCQQVTAAVTQSFSGNLAAGSSGISAFAGGGAVGTGSSGGGSGGSSSNFSDLSSGSGSTGSGISPNLLSNIKQGAISTSAGATGGTVGGGGGGGSSGPSTAENTEKPKPEDKGLKGLFKDVKNVLTNAFGGGAAKAPAARTAGNGTIDTKGFRPNNLRGVTQQREIASQNDKTIFELVNECANGLRCRSTTTNTMMTDP